MDPRGSHTRPGCVAEGSGYLPTANDNIGSAFRRLELQPGNKPGYTASPVVSRHHHWALFRPYSLIWLWTPSTPLPAGYTGNSRFSCGAISTGTVSNLPAVCPGPSLLELSSGQKQTHIQTATALLNTYPIIVVV